LISSTKIITFIIYHYYRKIKGLNKGGFVDHLEIKDLHVEVGGKKILNGINLEIPNGKTIILFGPNGCGKTTLIQTIIGLPQYKITKGMISFKGKILNDMPINERVKLGLGIMFQKPPAVKGVTLDKLIGSIADKKQEKSIEKLNMNSYLNRDINIGFSGGEIKRSEVLQLIHQDPDLVLFDEPESGVDIENLKILGHEIKQLVDKDKKINQRNKMGLIITHTGYILNYLEADKAYVMIDGKLTCSGNAHELFEEIQEKGFKECKKCKAIL